MVTDIDRNRQTNNTKGMAAEEVSSIFGAIAVKVE